MRSRHFPGTPSGLAAAFLLITAIPLAVLGWLGRRSLSQERALDEQRVAGALQQAASLLAEDVATVLDGWRKRSLEGSAVLLDALGSGATVLTVTREGTVAAQGSPLLYYPVAFGAEPRDEQLSAAERAELITRDTDAAVAAYRRAARSDVLGVRAVALAGVARVTLRAGKIEDALAIYDDLASLGETSIAGFPAELVALLERARLSEAIGDKDRADAAQSTLRQRLTAATYRLDRASFGVLVSALPNFSIPSAARAAADAACAAVSQQPRRPSGAVLASAAGATAIAIWRSDGSGAVIMVAPADVILASTHQTAQQLQATFTLGDANSHTVSGTIRAEGRTELLSLAESGLAASIVVTTSTPAQSSADRRTRIFVAAFCLLVVVVVTAAYAVFRSVSRELNVAQLQSDFVSTVSHEFRSPLTAMRHLTDSLDRGSASPGKLADYYRALARETQRLQTTVETVLDFGRLDSGQRKYDFREADVASVVRGVIEEVTDRADSNVRTINARGIDTPISVLADREALTMAVRNLLDNALKYSPASAPVSITVVDSGDTVTIAVHDSGPGLTTAEQRQVFRKFVRGSAAGVLSVKGTGLGLAMVDRVVRAHGGRIHVDSAPGAGSTFSILLRRRTVVSSPETV